MDIVFASSKGSQYRYFKSLSKHLDYSCQIVTLNPTLGLKLIDTGLTLELMRKGIDFHVQRKQAKLGIKLPDWMWSVYRLRSLFRFAWIYLSFSAFFSRYRPKSVGLWSGHRLPEMAIAFAARRYNVKVIYFENGLVKDSTTMDFRGVNDKNSVPRKAGFYREYFQRNYCKSFSRDRIGTRNPHRFKKQPLEEQELNGKRYVFVPFQVCFDSQVLINSNWIRSMEKFYDVLESVVESIADPDLYFVIKEHPSDPKGYRFLYDRHPKIIFSGKNTEQLIRESLGVLTINSSVGMESLLLEKEVIVVGEACYRVPDLVLSANTELELTCAVNKLSQGWCPNEEVLKGFVNYISRDYAVPGAWQKQQLIYVMNLRMIPAL